MTNEGRKAQDTIAVSSPKTPKTEASTPSPKKNKKRGKKYFGGKQSPAYHTSNKTAEQAVLPVPDMVLKDDDGFLHHYPAAAEENTIAHSTFASAVYSCCGQPFQIYSLFSASGPPHSPGAMRMNPHHQASDLAMIYTSGTGIAYIFVRCCYFSSLHLVSFFCFALHSGLRDCGLHFEGGFPELVVFDVPACKVDQVCRLFAFLAHQMEDHRLVKGGEIVDSDDLVMETKWIASPQGRRRLFDRFPFLTGMSSAGGGSEQETHQQSKWLALQPQFPVVTHKQQPRHHRLSQSSYPRFWGSRPPAPEGRTNLRDHIVDIFMTKVVLGAGNPNKSAAPALVWFVDGNPKNNSLANKQDVTLHEAFSNPYMKVDWSRFLNGDEALISYTKTNMEHFATIFKPRSDKVMTKHDEDMIRFKYHLEFLYSPYSPANNQQQQRGYLNLESPTFQPHNNLSLPEVLPFGF
jgi:hypothetical protein